MNEQEPLPSAVAWQATARCAIASARLLRRRRVHLPHERVGLRVRFTDGTSARVYRETLVDRPAPEKPCVLLVEFRLRAVRGFGHNLFRWESVLNTLLFVGFPGFVAKLWMAHDEHGVYRGIYQWDGVDAAQAYAQALWRVLALVSEPDSIHYQVVPGRSLDDFLHPAQQLDDDPQPEQVWWRPQGVSPP